MKKLFIASGLLLSVNLHAAEISGNVGLEAIAFTKDAQFADQMDSNLTLSFQPKIRHNWSRDDELIAELFFRADGENENRNHADIRELKWLHIDGDNEWRIGIDRVFWGVTESQHLVDVINTTDRVEGVDGEDKLGQPMIHFTTIKDWGVFHVFVLPGFRESEFNSVEGRLRFPLPVDTDQTTFESADEEKHIDVALRYTHAIGDTEFGLSWFEGTSREPLFNNGFKAGQPVLIPHYVQMSQFGLDLLTIVDDWIWKWELIHREQESEAYWATTAGFEYTFYGVLDSSVDMGALAEYSWDERDPINAGIFNNDLFAGLRFAFNDVQSTEILAGLVIDTEYQSKTLRAEASRRLGDSWKLTAEMQLFRSIDPQDLLQAFKQDDFIQLELAYYY